VLETSAGYITSVSLTTSPLGFPEPISRDASGLFEGVTSLVDPSVGPVPRTLLSTIGTDTWTGPWSAAANPGRPGIGAEQISFPLPFSPIDGRERSGRRDGARRNRVSCAAS
jgi:hypothetical protein